MITEWTCIDVGASTSNCVATASSTASVQDLGSIFGLGILIVAVFLMIIGFMFNHMNSKKPWL